MTTEFPITPEELGYHAGTTLDDDAITTRFALAPYGAQADIVTRPWSEEGQSRQPLEPIARTLMPVQLMVVKAGVGGLEVYGNNSFRALGPVLADHPAADTRYSDFGHVYRWVTNPVDMPALQCLMVDAWLTRLAAGDIPVIDCTCSHDAAEHDGEHCTGRTFVDTACDCPGYRRQD